MTQTGTAFELPRSSSPNITLANPTREELIQIWKLNSTSWHGALTPELYVEKEAYLTSILLSKPNGITHWILTVKNLGPDKRPILASCETIPKRCFLRGETGDVREHVVQGVAGVFCDPALRGRGYASRMMRDLGCVLRDWQENGVEGVKCVGSVLWSDVGKHFYADCGWIPFPSKHVEFPPTPALCSGPKARDARPVLEEDVGRLCEEDEACLRKKMTGFGTRGRNQILALVADHYTMLWHHKKEEFICEKLFGKQPLVKGAVVGEPGNRIWAIWTHGFHGGLDDPASGNTLYILRLVIEKEVGATSDVQAEGLKAVLQAAQAEAAEWKLLQVELWNPDSSVRELINHTGIEHLIEEREKECIPSLLRYGEGSEQENQIKWMANEKFAWC